jgi:hypothetical protein
MSDITGPWSKGRILFLVLGVALVGVGIWMVFPHLFS